MIFLTSDQHFGHKNIIEYCQRPFASVEEMDEALIANWNRVVGPDDIVNVIGDFSFHTAEKTREIAGRLNGRKVLVIGNHDRRTSAAYFYIGFESVLPSFKMLSIEGDIELNHFPLYQDPPATPILFHGHAHNMFMAKHYVKSERILLNFSVENWNYTPVSWTRALRVVREIKRAYREEHKTLWKAGELC